MNAWRRTVSNLWWRVWRVRVGIKKRKVGGNRVRYDVASEMALFGLWWFRPFVRERVYARVRKARKAEKVLMQVRVALVGKALHTGWM